MRWRFQPAARCFDEVRKDWDALNQLNGSHILLDSQFVAPLLRHFGGAEILLGISQDSRRAGMALVENVGSGIWQTFQPSQAPLGLILLGYRDETGDALREMMRSLPGYPLQFAVMQQDPDFTTCPASAARADIELLDYIQTPRLNLAGTFEEFWQSRGANLRHNLERQRRRLRDQNCTLELLAHRDLASASLCVREYGRLETQGWKGQEGTAVAEDNAQGRFYREIFETFCARGEGVIFQLVLGGKVVASDLCLTRDGMLVVLKTAYDEGIERLSPALLMRQEIVRQLYADKKVRVIEYYGRLRDWHAKWSDHIRMMYHLNCYRHRWLAQIKKMVKRFR